MSIKRIIISVGIVIGTFSAIGFASASTWTNLPVDGSGNVTIGPTSTLSGNVNVSGTLSEYGVAVPTSTVTSFTGAGCVTATNSTGTVALTVTCISGNQNITFTIGGDATGTATGTTTITDNITVIGLDGHVLPAVASGTLQYTSGAWKINLATNSLGLYDANGNLSSFSGSSFSASSGCITSVSISGAGALSGATSTCSGGGGGASTSTSNTWAANQTFTSSTLLGNASNIYVGTITGDPGTFVNSLCNTYAPQATSSLNIYLPAMSSTFSTAINLTQRCNVYGVGPGTHLTWTGAAGTTSTIENFGDSNPHLSGGGINNLWLDSSGSATTTNGTVGLYMGGSAGAAHAINSGLTISGFGIALDMGANTYQTGLTNSTLRGDGRNIQIEQANNSGESDYFANVFAVDPANSSSSNCVWFKNGSIENLTWQGGSIDNCQLHDGTYNQNVLLSGVNHEEPTYATYGNYDYEVIDADTHSSFNEVGGNFELVTPTSSSPMNEVISCGTGAICHYTGGIIYKYANATNTPFFASGNGNLTIDGLYNASAVNNLYAGNASTTVGYYGPYASIGNESVTGMLGVGSTTASTTNTLTINQVGSTVALNIAAGPQVGDWIYASDVYGDTFYIDKYGSLDDTAAAIGNSSVAPAGNIAGLMSAPANGGSDAINTNGDVYIGNISATTSVGLQASSTIRIGTSGVTPGCLEMYEKGATSTLVYTYASSATALTSTTTKPSFCQ